MSGPFVYRSQGCPCGYFTDTQKECRCTPRQIRTYLSRISGPLLDRIDIHIDVPRVPHRELTKGAEGEESEKIRKRVIAARLIQIGRLRSLGLHTNARMGTRHVKKFCVLKADAEALLAQAMEELALSARAWTKILKIGRTIADLDGADDIRVEHISEAIQYRSLDRNLWA